MEDFLCIIASDLEVPIIKTRTAALRGSWFLDYFHHIAAWFHTANKMISPHDTSPAVRVVTTCAREKRGFIRMLKHGWRAGAEQSELRSLKSSVAVGKWKVKADIVQHMATIIKLGGKSAKQAMLNLALRLSSQGAKREWPCTIMKVYSCEIVLRVCVVFFGAPGLCIRAKERWLRAWATFFMPLNMVKRARLFVCLLSFACVCAPEWEIYAGKLGHNWVCFCARRACACI